MSVARDHCSRARRSSEALLARSSPRNGSSSMTRRAWGRPRPRPKRTRCPSPPDTSVPPSPSVVCRPSGSCSITTAKVRTSDARGETAGLGAPELEVVDERSIPELDSRIHPGRLLAKCVEAHAVERSSVYEHVSGGGTVPPEQQAHERRFAGPRGSDDRDVRSRLDDDRRVFEDRVTTGPDGDLSQVDAKPIERPRHCSIGRTVRGLIRRRSPRAHRAVREAAARGCAESGTATQSARSPDRAMEC